MFVSVLGRREQSTTAGAASTTETSSLTCWRPQVQSQGSAAPSKGSRTGCSLPLPASDGPLNTWCSLARSCVTRLCVHCHMAFSLRVRVSFKDTIRHRASGPTRLQDDLVTSAHFLFAKKVTSWVPEGGALNVSCGGPDVAPGRVLTSRCLLRVERGRPSRDTADAPALCPAWLRPHVPSGSEPALR